MPEKYMAETGSTEDQGQELKSRTGGQAEDSKKEEQQQKRAEKERKGKELIIELKVDSSLSKEVKELVKNKIYQAKAKDGTPLSQEMLSSGDFAVGLRDFDQFIIINTKTKQEFEVSTARRIEDTRQVKSVAKRVLEGVEYQVEYDVAGQEISRTPLNKEPILLEDAKGAKWAIDPKTGYKVRANMAGGAPITPDEEQRLYEEALIQERARLKVSQDYQRATVDMLPQNFQNTYNIARQRNPNLPAFDSRWAHISDSNDPNVIDQFYEAMGYSVIPSQDEVASRGRQLPPDDGVRTEAEKGIHSFEQIYNEMVANNILTRSAGATPTNIESLNAGDREIFLANLGHVFDGECDMSQILQRVVESGNFIYPGQELSVILRIDKAMGLGGDLVRRAVEQRMAVEEYDDSKQMRQENIGTLFNAINQYLTPDLSLQHELRVLVYVRLKLHETAIQGRYISVEKYAKAMTDFYEDEFRRVEDTRLFKESAMILESEYGAYFRKGLGFGDRDREIRDAESQRYDPITIKMALLLIPSLPDEVWREPKPDKPNTLYCGFDRKTAILAARRFVEKTNLYKHNRVLVDLQTNQRDPVKGFRQATWDEVLEEMVAGGELPQNKAAGLKNLLETKSTVARLVSNRPNGLNFDRAYRMVRAGYDLKVDMDTRSKQLTPMSVVAKMLNADTEYAVKYVGRELSDTERQSLVDIHNEANRAFGLSIKVFDVYASSTRYDGLIDKNGRVMKPKTAILEFPSNITWEHILKEDKFSRPLIISMLPDLKRDLIARYPWLSDKLTEFNLSQYDDDRNIAKIDKSYNELSNEDKKNITDFIKYYIRDPKGMEQAQAIFTKVQRQFKGIKVDLAKLDGADDSGEDLSPKEKRMLSVVRGLGAKFIRDTRTRAMREMMLMRWDEIDINASIRGNGIREVKKVMWNQVYRAGVNTDTPGKKELLKYQSTDFVSLPEDNGRRSVLDQMGNWGDDFPNMKKWVEEACAGVDMRKSQTEGELAMYNSTSRLNDPIEYLKKYKDKIGDYTQEHRNDYMDFMSEGVIDYIVKHNIKNAGYENMGIVRVMNLMEAMVRNSVLTPKKKREIESRLYGGYVMSHLRYGAEKAEWWQAILGLFRDVFKESSKIFAK